MNILQVHNHYAAGPGGEDVVLATERGLLQQYGHTVSQYTESNSGLIQSSFTGMLQSSVQSLWSPAHFRALRRFLNEIRPDVVHVHNTFAKLSPSIFWAVKDAGLPCVLTLHNYRLICARSTLFRDGAVCEECVGRIPLAAYRHGCRYNGSVLAGSLIASTQILHRALETYERNVDAFIVLSADFASIMKRAGFPPERIHVKHNAVADRLKPGKFDETRPAHVVYVGQINQAKGVDRLLEAWSRLNPGLGRLSIVGDGPDRVRLQQRYEHRCDIAWFGRLEQKQVFEIVRDSRFLVLPSLWKEPFPLSVLEALMLGTPVIVSDHVPIGASVRPENAGVVYNAFSVSALAETLDNSIRLGPDAWAAMARNARRVYLLNFTPAANYEGLLNVYREAMGGAKAA